MDGSVSSVRTGVVLLCLSAFGCGPKPVFTIDTDTNSDVQRNAWIMGIERWKDVAGKDWSYERAPCTKEERGCLLAAPVVMAADGAECNSELHAGANEAGEVFGQAGCGFAVISDWAEREGQADFTALHELGHLLGIGHSHDANVMWGWTARDNAMPEDERPQQDSFVDCIGDYEQAVLCTRGYCDGAPEICE